MFCCFGSSSSRPSSSRPKPKHQRNTKHDISRVDALILPSSATGSRYPDHDRQTIELDIAPHTIPPTPRATRARLTDTDGVSLDVIPPTVPGTPVPGARPGRALPRPPSPTDPVMGRMTLPRSRGDLSSPSDVGERGTLSDLTCTFVCLATMFIN
jgi:hypothetical protein